MSEIKKSQTHKIVNKIERSAFPLETAIYGLTLSSNYAVKSNATKAYRFIISQLPQGEFDYVYSKSEKKKHHIHGIMRFKYKFDFRDLMSSRDTEAGRIFDCHIHYDLLATGNDYWNWFDYCIGQGKKWHKKTLVSRELRLFRVIPKTCIPEITLVTKVRSMRIKGI